MAVIAEEDRLLAEEIERARLEEEARIAAFTNQIADAPPAPPIPVAMLPERFSAGDYQIGSEQYMNELARAQQGSGFIAPEVSFTGEVITPGYDPATDPRAIAAEQAATSFKRQQLYGSLLRDGATAAEAFRFANSRYPDIRSAPGLIRAETAMERSRPIQPEIRDVGGVQMVRTGPQSWRPLTPTRAVPGRVTPAIAAQSRNIADEASLIRRALAKGVKEGLVPLPYSDDEKAQLRADLQRLEAEQQRILSDPAVSPNVDQTAFSRMRPAWEAAGRAPVVAPNITLAAAPVSETITVTTKEDFDRLPSGAVYAGKDGKRYRKP